MVRWLSIVFLVLAWNLADAQDKLKISGIVKDMNTRENLAFATVQIWDEAKLVTGMSCNEKGEFAFLLKAGIYKVRVDFVGYEQKLVQNIDLKGDLDLKIMEMKPSQTMLTEITVSAEKSSTELSLDKRVFNVGKDLASAGGSAHDILVNVPSVTVDPDGAVKLRGNSNVRILIDGKPSGMVSFKGGAGLRQLQASMIERVEVITNPSARYEAEGQAGIINIILKKDGKQGFNGSFEVITGIPTNYGAAANVNYRKNKLNFFVNYSLAYKGNPYKGDTYQEVKTGDSLKILEQVNSGTVFGLDNNIRGGLEYYFSEKNVLTASYLYSKAGGNRDTENIYSDFLNSKSNALGVISRIQKEIEREPMSEYVVNYKRSFKEKGHELSAQFRFLDHFENSDQVFTQNGKLPNGEIDRKNTFVQTSVNDEFEKQYLGQLDYTKPFGKAGKIEMGVRTSKRDMVNDYIVNDVDGKGKEIPIAQFNNYFIYAENISAVYGILSNKIKQVSYQLGLRGEYSDVSTTLRKTGEVNPRKYGNLFPSVHTTYAFNTKNSMQISYSKRIRRPVYNDLSPFMTLSDSRNFFSGNPNLNPEYSDVYEIGHLIDYEKGSLSSSVYYRNTKDYIFGIRRVDSRGFSTSLPENLLSEKAAGLDITASYEVQKWWKMDANLNAFNVKYDGSNIDKRYVSNTNTWFARHTIRLNLKHGWDTQIRSNYDAAQKTAQGSRKGIFFMDFSLKKNLWQKKGALNFSVLDVFNSRWNRGISEGPGFYTISNRQFRPRQINLTLSYRLKS
jgi:ferric enterobactin receptor